MTDKKNFCKKIKFFCTEHKVFTAVVIVEVLITIIFGLFLLTRQEISVSIPVDITTISNADNTIIDSNDKGEERLLIENIGLHLGGYETTVNYEFTERNPSDGEVTEGGYISFVNNQTGKVIDGSNIALTNLGSHEQGRLYTGYGQTVNIIVHSNKNGIIHISNVSLKENLGHRLTLFLGLIFVLMLVDGTYLFVVSKKISTKTKKVCGAILAISLLAGMPFFMNVLFYGHDLDFHLERIVSISSEISNGNMPVRMMTNMANEHTYPNSIFYCDIFLYIPALLYSMFVPLQVCYQAYCILIGLTTCIIAYCCLKKITKNTKVSVVGSALYTLSTYRLIDLALRAAIGEVTAMTFLPLIILGIYNIYTNENPKFRDWAPLGIGASLIVMCHIISLELCLGFIVLFCLIMLRKTFRKGRILSLLKAALLCVGLSFWFVLPFTDYTLNQPVDIMERGAKGFFIQSGVYPMQYLVPFDVAVSPGDSDNYILGMQGEMSFGLGISILAGLVLVGWFLIYNRHNRKIDKANYKAVVILTIFGLLALFMGSYLFPWDMVLSILPQKISGIIASVQFPWRFISVATVMFVFAISIVLANIDKTSLRKHYGHICFALMALVVISSTLYLFSVPHTKNNYVVNSGSTRSSLALGAGEYLPGGAKMVTSHNKDIRIEEGKLEEVEYKKNGDSFSLTYNNLQDKNAKVTLPTFAYRYMEAVDSSGNKIETSISDDKLISVELPPNSSGDITISFKPPLLWHVAEIVSVVSWLYCGIMYIRTRNKKTRRI